MLITRPPVEITENLYMLGTSEYPVFLATSGAQAAIIEGGVGITGAVVVGQASALGIDTSGVGKILVTHAHPDHVMAIPALRKMCPSATVLGSEVSTGTLSAEKAVAFFEKMDGAITESLIKSGSAKESHRPQPLDEMRIPIDTVIGEGDTVTVGELQFNVLATPGHSDCSLSFHEPETGILVISDAAGYCIPEINYCWPNYFGDYGQYMESLKRLASLDAKVLCLSHNGVITGSEEIKEFFDSTIAATEAYHAGIVEDLKAGTSTRQIAEKLGAAVYEKTQLLSLDFFQKNCGLLVKMSMKHEGIEQEG